MGYLDELNTQQKDAVVHTSGPLLILAGAGAGKTRVITYRILHLIESGIAPEAILAVTFTNKAAREMRERVEKLLRTSGVVNRPAPTRLRAAHGQIEAPPHVSTFHALGVDILRENFRLLGISKYFTIFDRADSIKAVRGAIKDAGYDTGQFEPRRILGSISRHKGEGVSLSEFEARDHDYYEQIVADVWRGYEKKLRAEKAFDFDDLLLKTVELLRTDAEVRSRYQKRFTHIHIDEYQDTNTVQNEFARLLVGKENNICVVGDVDQTIYTWRGAQIKNMLEFEKTYPGTKIILLEQNYRSTKTIITASNRIIEKNNNRPEKNLFTENNDGEKITVFGAYGEADEAYFVTTKVRELVAAGTPINEIAVLYRTNFQSRMLEEAFLDEDIPYHVLGTRFFDRKEVKDILSFIRLALNPNSVSDLARVVNVPPRGIGKVTLMRMTLGKENECTPKIREKIAAFRKILETIKNTVIKQPPSEVLKTAIRATGIEVALAGGNEEEQERLGNIRELVTLARKYDLLPQGAGLPAAQGLTASNAQAGTAQAGIEKLLADAALATDQDELTRNKDGVKLMTVHAAKGLEFDIVFITGLEEGLFPYGGDPSEKRDEEEERRLFYVALTRARKKVFLTHASLRTIFGAEQVNIPSEFITDIDDELLDVAYESSRTEGREKTVYLDLDEL